MTDAPSRTRLAQEGPSGARNTAHAFEIDALYQKHWMELVHYIRRAFGEGPPDPEDAVQQAFAQLVALAEPTLVNNPRAFLYRCAGNFVLDHKRRARTRAKFALSAEAEFLFGGADEITPERVLDARERAAILETAIRALKPRHREALILNRIQGMTYADIARSMKISESEARRLVTVAVTKCDRALLAAEAVESATAGSKNP